MNCIPLLALIFMTSCNEIDATHESRLSIYDCEYCIKNMHHHLNVALEDVIDWLAFSADIDTDEDIEYVYDKLSIIVRKFAKEGPWMPALDEFISSLEDYGLDTNDSFLYDAIHRIEIADNYYKSIHN